MLLQRSEQGLPRNSLWYRLLDCLWNTLVKPTKFPFILTTGTERLPFGSAFILAPTHRSRWDGLIVHELLSRQFHGRGKPTAYMSDRTEFKGVLGVLMRICGCFPVDTKAISTSSVRHMVNLLSNCYRVVIFPEGGVFKMGSNCRSKPGVLRLAEISSKFAKAEIPVIPCAIAYKESRGVFVKPLSVAVRVGEPLDRTYGDASSMTRLETTLQSLERQACADLGILQDG